MTRERIIELKLQQEKLREFAQFADSPKVLLLADSDSLSILGNEAGLIRLAVEILEVSAGGAVSPATSEWLNDKWLPLEAIVLDPDPELKYPKRTTLQQIKDHALLVVVLVLTIGIWLIGLITLSHWL